MKGLDSIASQLFEKIRSRFPRIEMDDENGTPTTDEAQARFFDFDYVVEGENQGAISISIKDPGTLKLYYSQGMLENVAEPIENAWYSFLKEMRFFAKKHLMGFDARDIAKSNLDKRDYKYLSNKVQESAMYGTTKSSYENLDKTRLIIRHQKEINAEQMGARARNIQSLFIENEAGERFKYPFNHLAGARAMARHVANGGAPHDDFGKHIIETSGNIAKLSQFKRYVQHKDFMNTHSNDIIENATEELENLRYHIKKLQTQGYYSTQKENFTFEGSDVELGEDIVNDLTNAFTLKNFNEDLKDIFPLLHSIQQKKIAETTHDLDTVVGDIEEASGYQGDSEPRKHAIDIEGDYDEDRGISEKDCQEIVYDLAKAGIKADCEPDENVQGRVHIHTMASKDAVLDALENAGMQAETNQPEDEFEAWTESVIDEAMDKQKVALLNKLINKHLAVGPDGTNAISSLEGIIDDASLVGDLKALAEKDADACARPIIKAYIQKNNPDVMDQLDFGDMKEDDTTDVTIGKDGAMKIAGDEEPKDEKASTEDIIEFVRSFYDKETGAFPKGETGVVISARKRFGDSVGDLVEKFVAKLSGKQVQVEDDDVSEAIPYMYKLKKEGKSVDEIAKELGMKPEEVVQAMKKSKDVSEGGNAFDIAMTDAENILSDASDTADAIEELEKLRDSEDDSYAKKVVQDYIDQTKEKGLGHMQSQIAMADGAGPDESIDRLKHLAGI